MKCVFASKNPLTNTNRERQTPHGGPPFVNACTLADMERHGAATDPDRLRHLTAPPDIKTHVLISSAWKRRGRADGFGMQLAFLITINTVRISGLLADN